MAPCQFEKIRNVGPGPLLCPTEGESHPHGCFTWMSPRLSNPNPYHLPFPNVSEADLTGANLIDGNLEGADLYDSKFIYALLIRANLAWTYIHQVDLVGANLSCANLSGAYFYLTNLTNTIWDECGITDENDDGYDDTSYDAGYVDVAESGDLNLDGANDDLDVVALVNNILNP